MTQLSPVVREKLVPILGRAFSFGFLGPGPIEHHLENAGHFNDVINVIPSTPMRALDLGSGGGVPGLVLAMTWTETTWVFLDAMHRRCDFLRDAIAELELTDRVFIEEGRAEVLGRLPSLRSTFDLVTTRSFGKPAVVAECAAPFLDVGGRLLVSEPPGVQDRWPSDGLAEVGLQRLSDSSSPFVAVFRQIEPCSARYPRRVGIPEKRPLF